MTPPADSFGAGSRIERGSKVRSSGKTDIGNRRSSNQDSIFASDTAVGPLSNLYIVADGMGGHRAGDRASKMAIEITVDFVKRSTLENPVAILKRAIIYANNEIYKASAQDVDLSGMGTTIVACTFIDNVVQVVNVGDSRMYIISPRSIKQVTVDHSLVEEMIRRGGLTRDKARSHPDKNVITRAVGIKPDVEADIFSGILESGDTVLLCTDGLTNMVTDERIKQIVTGSSDVATAAEKLINEANENGGLDNISVVLIKYEEDL